MTDLCINAIHIEIKNKYKQLICRKEGGNDTVTAIYVYNHSRISGVLKVKSEVDWNKNDQ